MYRVWTYPSPLGPIRLTMNEIGQLVSLVLEEGKSSVKSDSITVETAPSGTDFLYFTDYLQTYFEGTPCTIDPSRLAPLNSTPFRSKVWQELLSLSFGQLISYGELGRRVAPASKHMAQAIGQAVGANPIPLIIPCHRVVGSKGQLTGYAGGIPLKKRLLTHEGILIAGDRVLERKKGL